uniref:Uncharacterized protein n=1 Tax=viral metagenome TaxID=1070528 RepID=A0A6M3J4Z2_9ZZZZ
MATEVITRLKKVSVSKTLIADADYAANDVLSENKTTGTSWTFSGIANSNGRGGYIVKAHIIFSKSGGITAITPRCCLFLFSATPTSVLNDNAANTGVLDADKANYIGRIEFPALTSYGGTPTAVVTPSTVGNLPLAFQCATAATQIYGILITLDAITAETASTIVTINLIAEQD